MKFNVLSSKKGLRLPTVCLITLFSVNANFAQLNAKEVIETKQLASFKKEYTSIEEEDLDVSFKMLMNGFNSSNEFVAYLDVLKELFLRSENALKDFDSELDLHVSRSEKINFDQSTKYKKTVALWKLSHNLNDKIAHHYVELKKLKNDEDTNFLKKIKVKNMLKKFDKRLNSTLISDKIIFDEVKNSIEFLLNEKKITEKDKSLSNETFISNSFKDENQKIIEFRKLRESFQNEGANIESKNLKMTEKINFETENVQFVEQKNRVPNQIDLNFFPSTGSNGNVMGKVFPENTWALTYDDGPHPTHTPKIVENLKNLNVNATFFWLAENVISYPKIIDLVKENGHDLENHSWTHAKLTSLNESDLNKEIVKSTELEEKAYGQRPRFFRCPYGAGNQVPRIRQKIADTQLIHVFWNVDSLDWKDLDPDSIVTRTKKQMLTAGKGVILFHDIHSQSVTASKKLIEWAEKERVGENAIRWVTIPEIIDELNEEGISNSSSSDKSNDPKSVKDLF